MANETDWKNSPIAWFAALERALREEDFDLAAEAQHQLKRLGVTVSFQTKKSNSKSKHFTEQLKSLYSTVTRKLKVKNARQSS